MIFGKSFVLVATLSALFLAQPVWGQNRGCITCVATGGSWNSNTQSCSAAGVTTITSGRDCFTNNQIPSEQFNFGYDQNTDWKLVGRVLL
jgi:hypothetical protein